MLTPHQGFVYNKFQKPADWPKIEDTFDYKYDNGKLIGGNKNLYLSGSVDYTIVGEPTIIDGVVSGFSGDNYLQTTLNFDNYNTAEILVKITTPQTMSFTNAYFLRFGVYYQGAYSSSGFRLNNNNTITFYPGDSNPIIANNISSNTTYWLKGIIDRVNKSAAFYISSDNENYTLAGSLTNMTYLRSFPAPIEIGTSVSETGRFFEGFVDLNNTYIKVNDRLWFYGKNYTTSNMVPVPAGLEYNNTTAPSNGWVYTNSDLVKGPVGYTVVGNPTIKDGVVSNFSNNDYLQIAKTYNATNDADVEIYVRAKTPTTLSSGFNPIMGEERITYWGISVYSGLLFSIRIGYANATSFKFDDMYISGGVQANTWYRIKITGKNGIWRAEVYDDNETLLVSNDKNFSDIPLNENYVLQLKCIDFTNTYSGSIDLNQTYIKVNGQPWFGNVSRFQEFIPAPEEAQIGKDDAHNLAVETPIIKGQVDYSIVGNPTIEDNIVSGFSEDNYLLAAKFPGYNDDYEFQVAFTQTTSGEASLMTGHTFLYGGFYITGGKINFAFRNTDNVTTNIQTTNTITQDVPYIANVKRTGSTLTLTVYKNSVLDETITADLTGITASDSIPAIRIGQGATGVLQGSVDLNETYIKINNQYWFKPKTELLNPKLVGPVDYTVVGSPTIVDGVVSGFSANDYVRITEGSVLNWSDTIEFITKITTPSSFSNNIQFISLGTVFGYVSSVGRLSVLYDVSNGGKYLNSLEILLPDTTYFIKLIKDSSSISLYIGLHENSYELQKTRMDGLPTGLQEYVSYGRNTRGELSAWPASIDLNHTCIKVNGALWFGKEDWTPSTHTDNSIYLLGSHNTDYSNYNIQGINPTIETESDESGTYNVWIDNQEIYKEQSDPLDINWSNLALTTGYDITTPSTLKAHVIKVEPNNGNITGFSTDTNYKVENGLLTWASPKLYLEGPTQYTVVGEPTIENGVLSNISTSNYLQLPTHLNVGENQSFEAVFKIRLLAERSDQECVFTPGFDGVGYDCGVWIWLSGIISINLYGFIQLRSTKTLSLNTDYWLKISRSGTLGLLEVSTDGVNYETWASTEVTGAAYNPTTYLPRIGNSRLAENKPFEDGIIDLNSTYIKVDNELWFGKIYTSETDVPVPANFTYGNTTTSSNGTVNLTTQEFSTDTLATYGKDS